MGLDATQYYKGLYQYVDRYGEIIYRTLSPSTLIGRDPAHMTDGATTSLIGIFTRLPDQEEFQYAGYVSDSYKFIGNEVLNERVRESIQNIGIPILEENPIIWNMGCRMRNEIIIQNQQSTQQAGDIYPVMIVNNSYNGTRAATLSFGIAIDNTGNQVGRSIFGFTLGEMRQVHLANSATQMNTAVGTYMEVFSENIVDLISSSFNSCLTEDEMLSVLDVVEGIGKGRRNKISDILSELNPPQQEGAQPPLPSAWQVFLAIVRYSSFEQNLNIKRLLESAAESVLVIPPRMFEVLDRLHSS